jgi:hypothetical protein
VRDAITRSRRPWYSYTMAWWLASYCHTTVVLILASMAIGALVVGALASPLLPLFLFSFFFLFFFFFFSHHTFQWYYYFLYFFHMENIDNFYKE